MKVAVIPDASMIIVTLVTKYGHQYLSSTNISPEKLRQKDPYDERDFDESLPPFTMTGKDALIGNKYTGNETPSGLRGRMSLYDNIVQNSEAAIIMGKPPLHYNHMYDMLNEMILFGCVSCNNQQQLVVKLLKDKQIPILEVAYPTSRDDLINMIKQIRHFLDHIEEYKGRRYRFNQDNLTADLKPYKERIEFDELKDLINEI